MLHDLVDERQLDMEAGTDDSLELVEALDDGLVLLLDDEERAPTTITTMTRIRIPIIM